jgi:hypothetical protein
MNALMGAPINRDGRARKMRWLGIRQLRPAAKEFFLPVHIGIGCLAEYRDFDERRFRQA